MEAKVSQGIRAEAGGPYCAGALLWNILRRMVFRSVLAAWSLAAAFGFSSLAQTSPAPAQQSPAPAQSPGQSGPTLHLQDLPPDPHTPTPAEAEQQRQQGALNAAMRLATLEAGWGPGMDSPGLSIALAEVKRTKTTDGSTQITYQITGTGFAPDERLLLVRWPLNSEAQTVMRGIGFGAKGIAVCTAPAQAAPSPAAATPDATTPAASPASGLSAAPSPSGGSTPQRTALPPNCTDTMQPEQPVEFAVTAAPGEPIRVALMSEDRKHGAANNAIPFPVDNADKGCKLQVVLGMKDAALVLIEGTGFPPNTALKLDAITGANTRELHPKAAADGRIVVPVLTGAKGQTSGQTTVRFAGVNHTPSLQTSTAPPAPDPDCAPAVSFPWGEGSYKTE
jgi:hypothetical protein